MNNLDIKNLLEKYKDVIINDSSQIPNEEPIVRVGNIPFVCRGDISFVSGKAKSGKTQLVPFLIATAFHILDDSLGIQTKVCPSDSYVVYIDTEQSLSTHNKTRKRTLKFAHYDQHPENILFFSARQKDKKQLKELVKDIFNHIPKVHLLIVDGIGHFVSNVNEETESSEIIRWFSRVAEEHKTAIIAFLHENQKGNDGGMRGHLGSDAVRECGAVLSVSKDKAKKIHCIKMTDCRYDGEPEPIYFNWDDREGRMMSLDGASVSHIEEEEKELKRKKLKDLAEKIFNKSGKQGLANKTISQGILDYSFEFFDKKISATLAQRYITQMLNEEIITKSGERTYTLVAEKIQFQSEAVLNGHGF